jgi:hypothetical protein
MTHDELRALMPAYAAGLLSGSQVDSLRTHLASGCAECLGDLFTRRMGLPAVPAKERPPPERPSPERSAAPGLAGVVIGLLVALLVIEAGAFVTLRKRDDAEHRAFLETMEAERAEQTDRITALERELSAAETTAAQRAMELQIAGDKTAELEGALADAKERIELLTHRRPAPSSE